MSDTCTSDWAKAIASGKPEKEFGSYGFYGWHGLPDGRTVAVYKDLICGVGGTMTIEAFREAAEGKGVVGAERDFGIQMARYAVEKYAEFNK